MLNILKILNTVQLFKEYAPVLNSISKVRKWEKVAEGLVKMYQDDVLKKIVVIQHFYFGSILKLE